MKSTSFFTTQEAAFQLGISKRTLFRYEKRGIFPKAQRNKINGWRRYSAADIDYLKKIIREGI
jgi:DNA-binding transcriptional MerR regulator